jgi:ankyrin repeat protein
MTDLVLSATNVDDLRDMIVSLREAMIAEDGGIRAVQELASRGDRSMLECALLSGASESREALLLAVGSGRYGCVEELLFTGMTADDAEVAAVCASKLEPPRADIVRLCLIYVSSIIKNTQNSASARRHFAGLVDRLAIVALDTLSAPLAAVLIRFGEHRFSDESVDKVRAMALDNAPQSFGLLTVLWRMQLSKQRDSVSADTAQRVRAAIDPNNRMSSSSSSAAASSSSASDSSSSASAPLPAVDPSTVDTAHGNLCAAAKENNVPMIRALVERGSDVNETQPSGTALYQAAQRGHVDAVRVLLELDADPRIPRSTQWTPLHTASFNGHTDVLHVLLDGHLNVDDVNRQQKDGWTAVHLASQRGHLPCIERLLAAEANPDVPNPNGSRPLYIASQNGFNDIVQALIAAGADVNAARNDGQTAARVAGAHQHDATLAVLLGHGATL